MALWSPSKITTMEEARKHRRYALFILMVVYVFNFIDRQILNILQEPIKADLGLSDTQLGALTGLSFALIYCIAGIPVARLADATNRKTVTVGSLAIWSGFTAVCGLAGNYWHLLGARLGVGLGEAGGSPPAHAMLSDLYEKEKRGRALAIYSSGLYFGTLLGYVLGGWISDAMTWREAFFVVGIPGVLFAIVVWVTIREPIRGLSGLKPSTDSVTFIQSFARLWKLKSFRFYSLATGAGTFVTYGISNWMPPFLTRSHGEWSMPELQSFFGFCTPGDIAACVEMSRTEIGLFYGILAGIGGAIGTIGGGYLADKFGAKDRRWFLWVPMWGKLLAGPFFIGCLLAPTAELSLILYFPGIIMAAAYLGPSLAITHHLVPPSMRAMSSAVLFFILNILGLGTGPLVVGLISDWLTANAASVSTDWTFFGATVEQVQQHSARWGMVIAVTLTYPLCILWHLGAQALPKGELDEDGNSAAKEALTEGDPKGSPQPAGPRA
jgi:MFS family permease